MSKYAAIIVENRNDVTDIIENHKQFLPKYFDILHINDPTIRSTEDYSSLMTSFDFWNKLNYDKVLIFQYDSQLLRNGIEEFYEYDYVGAPWYFQDFGGNGGLSFRSVKAMLEITKNYTYDSSYMAEDLFFCKIMNENPTLFNLAPKEVCKKFSCETVFELGTLGFHAINRYFSIDQCNQIINQYKNLKMNRSEIIQSLIDKNKYTSYLEIGVEDGHCFNSIVCEKKVGVDPDPYSAATIHLTSNEFFKNNKDKFDLIFIDGLHHEEQADLDLIYSVLALNYNGTIVMHDCLPTSKEMQEVPRGNNIIWTGDVWKTFVKGRCSIPTFEMFVVDTDWGCGIMQPGSQKLLKLTPEMFTYELFCENKREWMNIISVDEFKKRFL